MMSGMTDIDLPPANDPDLIHDWARYGNLYFEVKDGEVIRRLPSAEVERGEHQGIEVYVVRRVTP